MIMEVSSIAQITLASYASKWQGRLMTLQISFSTVLTATAVRV